MDDQPNDLFIGLVYSLQMTAWMALGKVMNPMTQTVERNLEQAKETIDLLGVLEEKTRGNLQTDESRLLQRSLYELRLNYVDELKTPATSAPDSPSASEPAPAEPNRSEASEASEASQAEPPRPSA